MGDDRTQTSDKPTETRKAQIVPSDQMVADEHIQLESRRAQLKLPKQEAPEDTPAVKQKPEGPAWLGMACSGGGIRSATLNLGILQALTQKGLLPYVDYLSTVSGGGYIGTWLHGVIRNMGEGNPKKAAKYLDPPELKPHDEQNPDEDPVAFLRKYSSYLAPSLGLFSADFWVILVIWIRNTMLNQMILAPFLGAIALAAFLTGQLTRIHETPVTDIAGGVLALAALFTGTFIAAKGVGAVEKRERAWQDSTGAAVICAAALLISSVLVAFLHNAILNEETRLWSLGGALAAFWSLFATLQSIGDFKKCSQSLHRNWSTAKVIRLTALHSFIAAVATTGLIFLVSKWISSWGGGNEEPWRILAWGPPLVTMAWITGEAIHIGLMGANYEDFAREWLARVGAFVHILALAWILLFTLAVFGPYWISLLVLHYSGTATGLGGAWLLTTITGVLGGKSDQIDGTQRGKLKPLDLIIKAAPTIFVTGFLILISFAAFAGVRGVVTAVCSSACPASSSHPTSPAPLLQLSAQASGTENLSIKVSSAAKSAVPEKLKWLANFKDSYWCILSFQDESRWVIAGLLIGCGLIALGMQYCVNINEFSMHHFYKNRLVRAYMGASRGKPVIGPKRSPSRLTGFDARDDFAISELQAIPVVNETTGKMSSAYLGPYAIVNGTMNLNRGSELARQERQGESFIFTPLYCGFDPAHSDEDRSRTGKGKSGLSESGAPPGHSEEDRKSVDPDLNESGYRATRHYASPDGLDIGTCMGISGAAANPSHGYHTSATVAFLLTVFDVRLGWWLGNPRRPSNCDQPGPTHALLPLVSELFSQTDERAHWLNISDGGHFENLGIYELVRRRCKYIIAGDGEQDGAYSFGSLGGAIRKCRTDFGVSIEIDPGRIRPAKDKSSSTHCVVGRIHYPECEKERAKSGWLLYLKSSLTGDEPEDVLQYAVSNPEFPHEPTANQFFTESQFESYRKLGWHIAQTAFENVDTTHHAGPNSMDKFFQCLYQQWYPPSEEGAGVASRHAEAYMALIKRLEEPSLRDLGFQVFDWSKRAEVKTYNISNSHDQTIFLYCLQLIQLMENVWADLHFDRALERDGPRHRGWMGIFNYWAQQPAIRWTWTHSKTTFNPLFQQFFKTLEARDRETPPTSCDPLPPKIDMG